MRRYLIIVLILLTGCAGTRQNTYVADPALHNKALSYANAVCQCMNTRATFTILRTDEINASMNADGNLAFTEGLLNSDSDTLYFFTAHEIAHKELNHVRKTRALSIATTGAMIVLNAFIPGAGLLNHAINPAITKAFSRSEELDADKLASEKLVSCFNISIDRQVQVLNNMKIKYPDNEGGFWSTHPSWDDRMKNITESAMLSPDKPANRLPD